MFFCLDFPVSRQKEFFLYSCIVWFYYITLVFWGSHFPKQFCILILLEKLLKQESKCLASERCHPHLGEQVLWGEGLILWLASHTCLGVSHCVWILSAMPYRPPVDKKCCFLFPFERRLWLNFRILKACSIVICLDQVNVYKCQYFLYYCLVAFLITLMATAFQSTYPQTFTLGLLLISKIVWSLLEQKGQDTNIIWVTRMISDNCSALIFGNLKGQRRWGYSLSIPFIYQQEITLTSASSWVCDGPHPPLCFLPSREYRLYLQMKTAHSAWG